MNAPARLRARSHAPADLPIEVVPGHGAVPQQAIEAVAALLLDAVEREVKAEEGGTDISAIGVPPGTRGG